MATVDKPKCGICKDSKRLLQQRTERQALDVFICMACDGRLKDFTRFDGDLPRE